MSERDWSAVDVTGDPRLLLGRRKSSKKFEVHRVDVHEDLFDELREIAQAALDELSEREPKPYSTFGATTSDDYFDVEVSDIPRRRDKRKKEEDPEAYEIASALQMIAETDDHPTMDADQLREANPSLYAIAFESQGQYVGFIRNRNPQNVIKPGLRYLQYGDTLRGRASRCRCSVQLVGHRSSVSACSMASCLSASASSRRRRALSNQGR